MPIYIIIKEERETNMLNIIRNWEGNKMTHATAKQQGLEPVFPESHEYGGRYFYDPAEGKYYDANTDLYLEDFDPKLI